MRKMAVWRTTAKVLNKKRKYIILEFDAGFQHLTKVLDFKETANVILSDPPPAGIELSDPPCNDGLAGITTVSLISFLIRYEPDLSMFLLI